MNDRVVSPVLEILDEPNKRVRFAHQCESMNKNTKSFHQISLSVRLNNLNLDLIPNLNIYVAVSLVLDNLANHSPHPYLLQSFDRNIRSQSFHLQRINPTFSNSLFFQLDKLTSTAHINNLFIQIISLNQVELFFERKAFEFNLNDFDLDSYISQNLKQNFDSAKFRLQVIMHDSNTNKVNYLTEPVFSRTIENSMNRKSRLMPRELSDIRGELKIFRTSRITGSVNGNDEMFLFCSHIEPNDVEVEFFQLRKDVEVAWREFAELDRVDVHHNCALVIRTPKFVEARSKESSSCKIGVGEEVKKTKTKPINKVYFRLFRPSTNEYSEKWVFYYSEEENYEFKLLFGKAVDDAFLRRYADKFGIEIPDKTMNNMSKNKNKRKKKEISVGDDAKNDELELEALIESPNSSNNDEDEDKESLGDEKIDENSENDEIRAKKIKLDNSKANSSNPKYLSETDLLNSNTNSPMSSLTQSTRLLKIDSESQTTITYPNNQHRATFATLEARFDTSSIDAAKLGADDLKLKANLDSCIAKMNLLADRTGKSLLKFAKTRCIHELIKTQRFLFNVQDDDGNTPMHLAIMHGNFDILSVIVDVALTIPYSNLINTKNFKQLTPLLVAAHLGEIEVCEFLLEANADLSQTDLNGCNAIHIACKTRNLKLLKILLKFVQKECQFSILNGVNHEGQCALHLAVINESLDLVRELLYMKNLKINIQDRRAGYTALHYASGRRSLIHICNLLVNNPSCEIDLKAFNGCTPLHLAVANKNYLIASLLVNRGADLSAQSEMQVHCEFEMFEAAIWRDELLRRCVEKEIRVFKLRKLKELNNEKRNEDEEEAAVNNEEETTSLKSALYSNLNHVKLSQEVFKIYESELDIEKEVSFNVKLWLMQHQHNFDAFYYAQNDPWMLEIFECKKTIKRNLLEKIICYETFKRLYSKTNKLIVNDAPKLISSTMKLSKEKLSYLEANKTFGQIKLSQQETAANETIDTNNNNTTELME